MRLLRHFPLLAFVLLAATASGEETKPPRITEVPAELSTALPDCDRVELFLLSGEPSEEEEKGAFPIRPYQRFSPIVKQQELKGEDAMKIVKLWRGLTFDLWQQSLCHFPIYGLRFYQKDQMKFETSICIGCSNFYHPGAKGGSTWHGFHTRDEPGKAFVDHLNSILPYKKAEPAPEQKTEPSPKASSGKP